MMKVSSFGKRTPTLKLVGCQKCHKIFEFDLDNCPHCGFDRSKLKRSGQWIADKEVWR